MKRLAFLLLLVAFGLIAQGSARAQQAAVEVEAQAEADTVEVGAPFRLTLQAFASGGAPTQPELGRAAGFEVRGPGTSTSSQVTIVNGRMTQRIGINAQWELTPTKPGRFTIGPSSVAFGGSRYAAQPVTVRVVPRGQAPARPSSRDRFGSPFDIWKSPFFQQPQRSDDIARDEEIHGPQVDPKLQLEAPRGQLAFLHATVDKTEAVVGEQVTFTVYLYVDASSPRRNEYADPHEARISDFVKRALVPDDSETRPIGYATIQGKPWLVEPVRTWALFPIRSGSLEIGPMSLIVARPRVASPLRQSESITVKVTEPPSAGRPPGYAVGDVGQLSLTADVSPRDLEQGGALAVNVDLSGTGSLPSTIAPPVQRGVEWLEPQTREEIGPQDGKIGGKRTFQYVVRVTRDGDVDLGDMTLPYWDPSAHRYAVARAQLGVVHVKPNASAAAAASAETKSEVLPGLPAPRAELAGAGAAHAHLLDGRAFWLAIFGGPLAFAAAFGVTSATRSVRRRVVARASSPAREARDRMAAAEAACKADDARAANAAIARAVESWAIASLGVNVRGALRTEVAKRLSDAGAHAEASAALESVLRECEDARFSPGEDTIAAARDRLARSKRAMAAAAASSRAKT